MTVASSPVGSIERLRVLAFSVAALAIAIAATMIALSSLRFDPVDSWPVSLTLGCLLALSVVVRRVSLDSPLADALAMTVVLVAGGLAGGAIATVGLYWGRPLVDAPLLAMDRALGFDPVRYSFLLADLRVMTPLRYLYSLTMVSLFISILLQLLLHRRVAAWRAAVGFVATLLVTSLIASLTPAKGFYVGVGNELIARMPETAGRYFWAAFDQFHSGRATSIGIHSLDGVVSFPSFHTIAALLTAACWHRHRLFPVAALYAALVIASTVPLGGHYLTDLLGGAAIFMLWTLVRRRWEASTSDRRDMAIKVAVPLAA